MKQPTRDTSLRLRTEVTVRTKLASIAQIARNDKDVQVSKAWFTQDYKKAIELIIFM